MTANDERLQMVFEADGIPLQGPPEQAETMDLRAQYLASTLPDSFSLGRYALYLTDYDSTQPEFDDLYSWVRGDQQ